MISHAAWNQAVKAPLRRLASTLAVPANNSFQTTAFPRQPRHTLSVCFKSSLAQRGQFLESSSTRNVNRFFKDTTLNATHKRFFTGPTAPRLKNTNDPLSGTNTGSSASGAGASPKPGSGAAAAQAAKIPLTQQAAASGTSPAVKAATEKASIADQNQLDWKIFKDLSSYIWPKNDRGVKIRVVVALGLLVMGKILNVQVPFFFKEIIDKLNVEFPVESTVIGVVGAVILG
ncbi:Iron-sulfur clusters transporter atm1, mitochondrial, partial [Linnemannia elongata]